MRKATGQPLPSDHMAALRALVGTAPREAAAELGLHTQTLSRALAGLNVQRSTLRIIEGELTRRGLL